MVMYLYSWPRSRYFLLIIIHPHLLQRCFLSLLNMATSHIRKSHCLTRSCSSQTNTDALPSSGVGSSITTYVVQCTGVSVLDIGMCPYFLAVPNHGHVLRSHVMDSCLFLDILDITDVFWTFSFWTLVLSD
jgi:hypothetical protein